MQFHRDFLAHYLWCMMFTDKLEQCDMHFMHIAHTIHCLDDAGDDCIMNSGPKSSRLC